MLEMVNIFLFICHSSLSQNEKKDIPWKRFASASVGFPSVGIGTAKALFTSSAPSAPYFSRSPRFRLRTLPARILLRLPERRMLPLLVSEARFFNVLERVGVAERE